MKNKIINFIKENYVWLLALLVLLLTFVALAGPIVTAKGVSVIYDPSSEWYIVTKISDRSNVFVSKLFADGTYVPFLVIYCLVFVAIGLTVCGKYFHRGFYIASTLLLLCVGISFLISNIFYDLSLCSVLANEPNLLEDLHAVSDAKLAFGTTFSAVLCFAASLLNFNLAFSKDEFKVSDMAEVGILSALAIGLQFIKIPIGATGGSINLGLIPLFVIALRHGAVKGFIASAFVFGLITCLTDGYGFNTYPFDYLVGFGGCAVLGFFNKYCFTSNEKGYSKWGFLWISIGVIVASVIRFIGSTASSMINYGYKFLPACSYNAVYVFVTGAVSLGAMLLLYIPLARVNKRFPVK